MLMPWLLHWVLNYISIFQFREIGCNKGSHFTCAWRLVSSSWIWEELPCFFPSLKYSKNMDYNNKINDIADIQPHITPWHNSPPAAYGMNHNTGACCFLCEPTHPPVILACHATMSLPAEVGDLEEQLVNHTGYTLPYRDYFCLHDASGVCCGRRVTRRKVTRLPRAAPWLLACRESLMGAVVVGC